MNKIEYEVIITGANNGISVELGCKRLVFGTKDIPEFIADLTTYLTKGREGQKEMYLKYFHELEQETYRGDCEVPREVPPVPTPNQAMVGNRIQGLRAGRG